MNEELKELFPNPSAYKTALELSKEHFTIREYEELQEVRLSRLKFFESINQPALIDAAKDLHTWGEEVLGHLKGIYSQSN